MKDKTQIANATFSSDVSGLKLDRSKAYSNKEIYFHEAKNILAATLKYLKSYPSRKQAPFDYDFFLNLHKEMFGNVWDWAGKPRTLELNFGVKAYQIRMELKKLVDDLDFWHDNKSFDTVEIAARLHHRAVVIHPFLNGNGRWSRMLANIYLKQNKLAPTAWNEDLLSKDNPHRQKYIQALKLADGGDYSLLIKLQANQIKT